MSKVQKIIQAKSYMEFFLHGMDPITGDVITKDTFARKEVYQNVEYIISLLDELLENNGEVISMENPVDFAVEKINKNKIKVSETPLQITGFASRINKLADSVGMKRLGPSKISNWLVSKGYLQQTRVMVTKEQKQLQSTDTSEEIGIITEDKVDTKTGEVKQNILLTKSAQEFIIDNLENIVSAADVTTE
ncbi:MAG: hypothetical protein IJ309_05510 [Clostridia bacterium]|nr:hypothetical protein [Clostridia bacterium]